MLEALELELAAAPHGPEWVPTAPEHIEGAAVTTPERDRRRDQLDRLSNLDLTLMAGDYLASLEHYVAAKDWQSAETLTPDLELLDDLLQERGFYDGRNEGERKRRKALLEEVKAVRRRA